MLLMGVTFCGGNRMFNLDRFEKTREEWLRSRTTKQLEQLYDGAWMCNNLEAMKRYEIEFNRRKSAESSNS